MQNSLITTQLNDEILNQQATQAFINYVGQECSIPGFTIPKPFKLVKAVYCNEYRILSDGDNPRTLFYIRLYDSPLISHLTSKKIPSLNKNITQCLVWTSLIPQHRDAFHFIATKFFDYFLNQYNIATVPGQMTLCSANFWEGRLLEAFKTKNAGVFTATESHPKMKVKEIGTWFDFQKIWTEFLFNSSENIPDPTVIIISKKEDC